MLAVKAHVLRYWESEFPMLRPKKTRGHHRMYSPQDVELVRTIKRLLEDEGFTIAGARKFIAAERRNERKATVPSPERRAEAEAKAMREGLMELRRSLVGFLHQLDHGGAIEREVSVTVEKMVPSTVLARPRR